MKVSLRLCLLAVLVALPGSVFATTAQAAGIARLHAFLHDVNSLKADFTQTVLDPDMKTVKKSNGTLAIKRPNRFRWDYQKPFKQLIVADGRQLWLYDVELSQVTVKPLGESLASSPAVLLSGSDAVENNFQVTPLKDHDGLVWVELKPKVKDTDFTAVRLGFKGSNISVMELHDALGQTTRITFSHLVRNPAIPSKVFSFTPPAGVDVIGKPENRP